MEQILGALVSYIFGSIPTAYLVAGKEIFEVGSGNVGVLNVKRVTGALPLALVALMGDVAKVLLAFWIVENFFPTALPFVPFFLALGHNYPIWTGFRGGRGIAVLLVSALYLDPYFALIWVALWGIGYFLSGYIAVGAMLGHILTPILEKTIFGVVSFPLLLALIPIWMRYREKADLLARSRLKKHFWGRD